MKKTSKILILILVLFVLLAGCTDEPEATPTKSQTGLANPASENCATVGGTLQIETRGDGGQIGVCYFEDNRQCEEWALLRGECPVGGRKITGYITPAGRYCAISGGEYAVTAAGDEASEQGTCTLPGGAVCDAWKYWYGTCSLEQPETWLSAPAELAAKAAPSGQIAFSSNRGGDYLAIYTSSLAGSDLTVLAQGDANYFAGPWSPDGSKLLFTGFELEHSYVGVMNADGSAATDLSQQPDSDEGFPAWSPDGTKIAFTSYRDGNNEIYVMNADGSGQVRLTNSPTDDFAPSWSPDGTQIVFASDRERELGYYSLYVMASDGSAVRRLTSTEGSDYSPDWSPDGTKVVFRSGLDAPADIYVINADGSNLQQLTSNQGSNWSPSWSPDGTQIIFASDRDGNWEIYVMNADGSGAWNVTQAAGEDQYPEWSR